MKTKKSINSRRGGGSPDSTMTWWKYLFLASLILMVSFLVRLNYQLVKKIGPPASGDAVTVAGVERGGNDAAASASINLGGVGNALDEDSDAQKRLTSLRNQVSSMKEKVGTMKGMVKEIKGQDAGASLSHR